MSSFFHAAMPVLGQITYVFLLIFYSVAILIFGYALAFADTESGGLNGRVSRFIFVDTPQWISKTLASCLGPSLYRQLASTYDYAVNERNPIMQVVYLIVLNVSFFCWLIFGAPLLPNGMIGYHHKYIAYLGVAACHYSFYIACKKSPGVIVSENIRCFSHNPYDGALYVDGYGCRTCDIKKVTITL